MIRLPADDIVFTMKTTITMIIGMSMTDKEKRSTGFLKTRTSQYLRTNQRIGLGYLIGSGRVGDGDLKSVSAAIVYKCTVQNF